MGREGKVRFMCLACGRFYWAEAGSLSWGNCCCPYCKDIFYADNIVHDIPVPMYGEETYFNFECGHEIGLDVPGDAVCCPICMGSIENQIDESLKNQTLKNWQSNLLERIGI